MLKTGATLDRVARPPQADGEPLLGHPETHEMTDTQLEQLIREWYRQGLSDTEEGQLTASEACPPLTLLWRHVAEHRPLGEYDDHVADCDRCRRLTAIIEKERSRLEAMPAAAVAAGRRTLSRVGGLLALAACVAFVVVSWPQASFDGRIATLWKNYDYQSSALSPDRGRDATTPGRQQPDQPEWVRALLADDEARRALDRQSRLGGRLLLEITGQRIRVDPNGRLSIAPGLEEDVVGVLGLEDLIQEDNALTDRIVDALMRYIPGASDKDRPALERAFRHWRAENVFGVGR